MEDKKAGVGGQQGNQDKDYPPVPPNQEKGSNDPNFPNENISDKNRSEDKTSRELLSNPNFASSEEEIHKEEDVIDPGNEHRH